MDEIQNSVTSTKKTVSTSERGHAKNVANFEKLIAYVNGFGTSYNPANPALSIENLQALHDQADAAVKNVNHLLPPYSVAVANRKIEFEPLRRLSTRLLSAVKALNFPKEIIENASTVKRKIDGRTAPGSKSEEIPESEITENKKISTSQQSYDSRLNNFDKLFEILSNLPEYTPNEPELQLEAVNAFYQNLKQKNKAAVEAAVPLVNARIARNKILYDDAGLYTVALDCKNYVKSVFGSTSPEFKSISGISFSAISKS